VNGPLDEVIAELTRAGAQYRAARARVAEEWRDNVWRAVDERVFGTVDNEADLLVRALSDVDTSLAEALRLIR
jgi:hypothetical protein